jgi:plasmid stabilization system protein ParE
MKVVWTEPAETDLDEIFDYIARDAPIYAEQYIDRILEAVDKLADLPRVGRQVPEANSEYVRELVVQSQRVIYAIDDDRDTVSILALVHVRQDLAGKDDPPWRRSGR